MQSITTHYAPETPPPTDAIPTTGSPLRTDTGNRWPR